MKDGRRPSRYFSTKWIVLLGMLSVGLFAAFNWQPILLGIAALTAETRPELLRDAEWANPGSAGQFNKRFAAGSHLSDLQGWLRQNAFAVDQPNERAERMILGMPCNEKIVVSWRATTSGRLMVVTATITQDGCL